MVYWLESCAYFSLIAWCMVMGCAETSHEPQAQPAKTIGLTEEQASEVIKRAPSNSKEPQASKPQVNPNTEASKPPAKAPETTLPHRQALKKIVREVGGSH
mgnify:CR=1 FL=1